MNIAFYISGRSGRLSKYLAQASEDMINKIVLVFSDDLIESELREQLDSYSIRFHEIKYSELSGINNREKNLELSNKMLAAFLDNSIDYCISFGSHILSGELLSKYKNKIINFHPAILPMFPGINAIDQAKKYGNVLLIGNTAHFIDKGVDTGPIIMQSVTTMHSFLYENDYDIVLDQQIPMLNRILLAINNNDIQVIDDRVHINNADYSITHIYPDYND